MNARAQEMVLAWQQSIDAEWQRQADAVSAMGGEPDPPDPIDWLNEVGGDIGEWAGDVGSQIGEWAGGVGEWAGDVGSEIGERAAELGDGVRDILDGDDRLDAAVDKDVDVDAITPEPIWRDTDEPLYRSDHNRPEVIFNDGLEPRNVENVDLDSHVFHDQPSAFVATTTNEDLYRHPEYVVRPYRYTIDAPGGIDVVTTLPESRVEFPGEDEIAFPGGVDPRYIVGAHPVNHDGTLGEWEPNPNYDPE